MTKTAKPFVDDGEPVGQIDPESIQDLSEVVEGATVLADLHPDNGK
jgi:hypothetical protein